MSGYNDPFSGLFGNITIWYYFGWVGFLVFCMALIFVGYDSGGFLHRLEEKFGIKNVDRNPDDDEMV